MMWVETVLRLQVKHERVLLMAEFVKTVERKVSRIASLLTCIRHLISCCSFRRSASLCNSDRCSFSTLTDQKEALPGFSSLPPVGTFLFADYSTLPLCFAFSLIVFQLSLLLVLCPSFSLRGESIFLRVPSIFGSSKRFLFAASACTRRRHLLLRVVQLYS